jgi:hypothetical protein
MIGRRARRWKLTSISRSPMVTLAGTINQIPEDVPGLGI